jgi:hypothetical protein
MYTALYKIEYYDMDDHFIDCGLLYAESFSHAMKQLEDYYKDTLLTIHFLELYDVSVFTFDPEQLPTMKKIIEERY